MNASPASTDPHPAAPFDPSPGRRWSVTEFLAISTVAAVTALAFSATLQNGFLSLAFDDGLILDNPYLLDLHWRNIAQILTTPREANYIPLTTLTFALDHHFWGVNPFWYHLVNVALHATNAVLVWVFLRPLLRSSWALTIAALVFALHPLQMEAVSLAIQRKTLLSGMFFLLSLILYQRWWATGDRRSYGLALLTFVASVASKQTTVTLPVLLLFYEYHFIRSRPRLLEKLPFFLVSLVSSLVALAASQAVAAVKAPHGGNWLAHALIVSRATMEYAAALFLPLNLSPIYYYKIGTEYSALNFLCLLALPLLVGYVTWNRRRLFWSFFCLGWMAVLLLPQSNVVPLAQLRPDRYAYLPLIGFGLWLGVAVDRTMGMNSAKRLLVRATGVAFVGMLGLVSFTSAFIWSTDVTAWTRVVERHPWCGMAYYFLGVAYHGDGDPQRASENLEAALERNREVPKAHLFLARSYEELGLTEQARAAAKRFLQMKPTAPEGLDLMERLQAESRSSAGPPGPAKTAPP